MADSTFLTSSSDVRFSYRKDPGTDGVGVAFTSRFTSAGLALDLADNQPVAATAAARAAVASALNLTRIITVEQVHGTRVVDETGADSQADAIVTTHSGIGLAVRTADCLPVLFADAERRVVGAAHAGRVGLLAGVLEATVRHMRDQGARSLTAWIGPAICGRCYEVAPAMAAEAAGIVGVAPARTSWGTPAIDLPAMAVLLLSRQQIPVTVVDICTRESADQHSYRRDGINAGRNAGIVWLEK